MKKRVCLIFYSMLAISLVLLVGCSTTASDADSCPYEAAELPSTQHKQGLLPSAIQVVQSPDRLRIVVYSDVCFQKNGYLSADCARQLSNTMKLLKSYGDGVIYIIGYTDDIYDSETARAHSKHQAELIAAFLWVKNISSQRLKVMGCGTRNFVASNRDIRASRANRRVEIIRIKN